MTQEGIRGGEHYIAFLDVLGFRDRLTSQFDLCEISNIFEHIKSIRNNTIKNREIVEEYDLAVSKSMIRIMSDSIVVAVSTVFEDSLSIVAEICMQIQEELLVENHILLRGAITKGDFYYDNEVMFGPGLVRAYLMEERAQFPRIIIAKELVTEYVNRVGTTRMTYITDFLLKDEDEWFFINCFHQARGLNVWLDSVLAQEKICDSVRTKYLWCRKWVNYPKEYIRECYAENDYPGLF